jgi:hypothetical protein
MTHNIYMIIIEPHIFTRQIQALVPDDEYRRFQQFLLENPDVGEVIPGSGGL